jgi:phosphoglycolate phosphatase
MHYRLAIFDFDGTLADSFPFFLSVHNTIADRHGFRRIEPHEVPELRHRSPREIMKRAGLPLWKLPVVAQSFTTAMRERADEIPLFAGVDAALAVLQERGVTLALVTSNAIENVRHILGATALARFAHLECGASIFGKAALIKRTIKRIGIEPRETIYVGDQVADAEAAREARVAFGAVAWGYASIESLTAARPDALFNSVADLQQIGAAG